MGDGSGHEPSNITNQSPVSALGADCKKKEILLFQVCSLCFTVSEKKSTFKHFNIHHIFGN